MSAPIEHSNVIQLPVRKHHPKRSNMRHVRCDKPIDIHRGRKRAIAEIKVCKHCHAAYFGRCLRCIDLRWHRDEQIESFKVLLDQIHMTKKQRTQFRSRFVNARTFKDILFLLIELLTPAGGCNDVTAKLLEMTELFTQRAGQTHQELVQLYLKTPAISP